MSLLQLTSLSVVARHKKERWPLLRALNVELAAGETLGIVGESGSGKSLTMLAIMGLLPAGLIAQGRVMFDGVNLLDLSPREIRSYRGQRIAMIFQEPMRALNPLLRIENQIREVLRRHALCRRREERARVQQLLREVGLDDVARVARCYPFQLSGGMQQRVMIAMALAGEPQLLIADEPTTALDVCVQAGILDLLQRLQRERGLAILLVSHDLSVVADRSDAIAVMYAGQLVEKAPAASLMAEPVHPYTRGLLASVARMDTAPGSLRGIEGAPPDLRHLPPGCAFAPRCPNAEAHCLQEEPSLQKVSDDSKTMLVNRLVRCPVALQSCVSGGNDVA